MSQRSRTAGLVLAALASFGLFVPHALRAATPVEGWIDAVWIDEFGGSPRARRIYLLHDDQGVLARLDGSDARLESWRGKRVVAELEVESAGAVPRGRLGAIAPAGGTLQAASAAASVTGQQNWINLLCRFADSPGEPALGVDHFAGMFAAADRRLPDYWREVSYGRLAVAGSAAGWFTLPKNKSEYAWSAYPDRDYGALFADCTAAADGEVDFSQFDGINLFFEDGDERSFGGHWTAELDGEVRTWRTSWLTSSARLSVVAHEMGHALGLPHSNNSDRDEDPYDSPWDMMSMPPSWCPDPRCADGSCYEAGYGELPQQTIGYHRQRLGWLPAAAVARVGAGQAATVELAPLADGAAATPRLIEVPIPGTARYFTVEVRKLAGYDSWLPRAGVIIHEVDPARTEPAWLVERTAPPADQACGDAAVWDSGEEFRDPSGIVIRIGARSGAGYRIEIGAAGGPSGACSADAETLCIDRQPGDRRFQVRASFSTSQAGGKSGEAQAVSLSSTGMERGGLFGFFAADNPELFVKILDGCQANGKIWVFLSAGTNVGFTVTVKDTKTGAARQYSNPDLKAATPVQDTAAFPCG